MTNSKATKRALLTSSISLLLCFAMLLGTTFAWFTDTVTNGVNKIVSGNLDVELWHSNYTTSAASGDGYAYSEANGEEVKADTKLFLNKDGEAILWEPGAEAVENFRIKNEGSLALKYMFKLEVAGATKNPEGKDLSDIIMLSMNETSLGSQPTPIVSGEKLGDGYVIEGEILPEKYYDFNVALNWVPSDRDNEFNIEGGLELKLGITLLATQLAYEKDDVNGDQYDAGAQYPSVAVPPITSIEEMEAALASGGNFVLGADIIYPKELVVPKDTNISIDLNGYDFIANSTESALLIKGNATLINSSIETSMIRVQSAPAGSGATSDTTQGIGVYPTGTLNIEDGAIEIGGDGIGIGIINYGTVNMNGGKITVSEAFDGQVGYGILNLVSTATVNMNGGEIVVDADNAYGILMMPHEDMNGNKITLTNGKITVNGTGSYGVGAMLAGDYYITVGDDFECTAVSGSYTYASADNTATYVYVNDELV